MLVIREAENEASRGTEGARRATGVARGAAGRTGDGPDTEVAEKATRRRFSGEYKRRIVSEADRCRNVGEVGALLRREGLYSSSLSTWRRQGAAGALAGTGSVKRGPKAPPKDVRDTRIAELERETRRLQRKLTQLENRPHGRALLGRRDRRTRGRRQVFVKAGRPSHRERETRCSIPSPSPAALMGWYPRS